MTTALDKLRADARALDTDQRAQLALELLESLDGNVSREEAERAWNEEAVRRVAEYDAGLTETVSTEELHASLIKQIKQM
jgi:putative addiction module component (TIGR02574 family)